MHEILTPDEMTEVDRRAIACGPLSGIELMRNAGAKVADVILSRYPDAGEIHILCGPGNNGGDGYVVSRLLSEAGLAVQIWALGEPKPDTDAALAKAECPVASRRLSDFDCEDGAIVIDALFGAGLTRDVPADVERAIDVARHRKASVVAVDLPSGVSGSSGKVLGAAFQAAATVTFVRRKPGHLLLPGRLHCGETVLADIGIADPIVRSVKPTVVENHPDNWIEHLPVPSIDTHKYSRGHVAVFSGGPSATGAARMSAMAAARIGAGAVTMLSPANALSINAAHLTSIILHRADGLDDVREFLNARKPKSTVFGPGLGPHEKVGQFLLDLWPALRDAGTKVVLDADGLTSMAKQMGSFVEAAKSSAGLVLTPHEGEFKRLFPEVAADENLSKLEKARAASRKANAVLVYKGPDTVISAPDGRASLNSNATPLLATAGSGDVLAGLIAGLLAQGMPDFEAACAAVWIHAEAATRFGAGLVAEDLPTAIIPVLQVLASKMA